MTEQHTSGAVGFTPGPWWVDDRRAKGGALQIQVQHRGEGSSYCIASVNEWESPEDNARLMAASPEMYEALKIAATAELYDPATGIIDADVLDIVQEQARAALRLATDPTAPSQEPTTAATSQVSQDTAR